MRRLWSAAIFCLLALSLVPSGAQAQACTNAITAAGMTEALAILNQQRAAARLSPVVVSPQLTAAALQHACDMLRTGNRSHRGTDGSRPGDRVRRAGYRACTTAENIAWGQNDVRATFASWIASAPHLANIRHQRVQHVGFAQAGTGRGAMWVLVLARPC